MRIKLAEALAAGIPVVTTTKGMGGMELKHGKHVLGADDAKSMCVAMIQHVQTPALALRLGQAGRQWALHHLGHEARAQQFVNQLQAWVNS